MSYVRLARLVGSEDVNLYTFNNVGFPVWRKLMESSWFGVASFYFANTCKHQPLQRSTLHYKCDFFQREMRKFGNAEFSDNNFRSLKCALKSLFIWDKVISDSSCSFSLALKQIWRYEKWLNWNVRHTPQEKN